MEQTQISEPDNAPSNATGARDTTFNDQHLQNLETIWALEKQWMLRTHPTVDAFKL